jgi:hypothetical protein
MNYVFYAAWVVCGLIAAYYLIRKEEFLDVSKIILSLVVVCCGTISLLVYFLCNHKRFKLNNPLYNSQLKAAPLEAERESYGPRYRTPQRAKSWDGV